MSDIVERLRAEASDNKRYLVPDGLALEAADEIATLRAEVKRLRAALCADEQTLRLHLGEMTAQEMRTVKAGFKWVLARAALGEEKKG